MDLSVLIRAAFHDAADNPEDGEANQEHNHDDKPKRADDDGFLNSGDLVKDFDDGFNLENADGGGVVPSDFSITVGLWEDGEVGNNFFAFAIIRVAILETIIEEVAYFEQIGCWGVDITIVTHNRGNLKRSAKDKTGDFVARNRPLLDGRTLDI